MYRYLSQVKKTEPDFLVAPRNSIRSKGHRLKHRKFYPKKKSYLFTIWTVEHWHRKLREVIKRSSFEIFKT